MGCLFDALDFVFELRHFARFIGDLMSDDIQRRHRARIGCVVILAVAVIIAILLVITGR